MTKKTLTLLALGTALSTIAVTAGPLTAMAASAPVQVSFWEGMSGQLGQVLQSMVNEFNQTHPGIHVTATYEGSYSGGGPMQEKLLAAVASGKVPDLVQLEIHSMPLFSANGALEPLDAMMAASANDKKSDFLPGLLNNTSYQGKTYGIPFNRSVPVLYYNPVMFAKKGIKTAPSTWAQLEKDAKLLTVKGNGQTKVYGFEPVNQWWFFESLVWSNDGHLMNKGLTQATFDTPAAAAGMQLWQSMKNAGTLAANSGPNEWTQTIEDFGHGRTAMYIGSAGDMGQIKQTGIPYKAAFVPMFKHYAVPTGGANAAIMAKAPEAQKQAAWQFIEWFTQPAQTSRWSQLTGYMPVKKAALTSPTMTAFYKSHPNHKVPVMELAYAKQAPLSPSYLQVYQYIQNAMDSIMFSNQNVHQALSGAVQSANQAIAQG